MLSTQSLNRKQAMTTSNLVGNLVPVKIKAQDMQKGDVYLSHVHSCGNFVKTRKNVVERVEWMDHTVELGRGWSHAGKHPLKVFRKGRKGDARYYEDQEVTVYRKPS